MRHTLADQHLARALSELANVVLAVDTDQLCIDGALEVGQ